LTPGSHPVSYADCHLYVRFCRFPTEAMAAWQSGMGTHYRPLYLVTVTLNAGGGDTPGSRTALYMREIRVEMSSRAAAG